MIYAQQIQDRHERADVREYECSDCGESFIYGLGAPSFCPDCGAEFQRVSTEINLPQTAKA